MASFSELQELHNCYLEPRSLMSKYVGRESAFIEDSIRRVFPLLNKTFSSGRVKGEMLIQLSIGLYFQFLFPVLEYFTEIIIGNSTDQAVLEVEKWRANAPGALDCSHAAKLICELQGNRQSMIEKQDMFKRKIKQVLTYDVSKRNPLCPQVLPQADCLFLENCLECHMMEKEGFCTALKNVSSLLKDGGHLILVSCLEQTFYILGNFKFPHLSLEEGFVRKALGEAGYTIEELHVLPRTFHDLYDVADYSGVIYVYARKDSALECSDKS
ncbi:nicotinamide N-methyltransferase-like [Lissotriton helveticus]